LFGKDGAQYKPEQTGWQEDEEKRCCSIKDEGFLCVKKYLCELCALGELGEKSYLIMRTSNLKEEVLTKLTKGTKREVSNSHNL
jgi:hypothetical protein